MKVLLVGPFWANKKHGAEQGIFDALLELGHETSIVDFRSKGFMGPDGEHGDPVDFAQKLSPDYFDLILCPGPGLPEVALESLRSLKGTKVLWTSEPIRLPQYYSKFQQQQKDYDLVFTFDDTEINIFETAFDLKDRVHWLPQAFNPKWYQPLGNKPEHNLVFVGSLDGKWCNRVPFLKRVLASFAELNVGQCFDGQEVNEVYNNHKVILNLGLYHETLGPPENLKSYGLQQRIFEAIGAGKVCVTNEIPGQGMQMLRDRHTVLYFNENSLEETIEYGLDNHKQMEESIINVRENHTYKARLERLFRIVS